MGSVLSLQETDMSKSPIGGYASIQTSGKYSSQDFQTMVALMHLRESYLAVDYTVACDGPFLRVTVYCC